MAALRHEAAADYFRRAIELLRAGGDRVGAARVTARLGRVLIMDRHSDVAMKLLEAASLEFADLEGDPAMAALGGQLARVKYLTGNLLGAMEIADPVLRTAEHLELFPIIADTLVTKGSALAQDGRTTEGLALMRAGQELAEEHSLPEAILRAVVNQVGHLGSRDPRAALEIGRAGLAAARRLGHRNALVIGNTADAARRVGEWTWAVDLLDDALQTDFESANRGELIAAAIDLHVLRGDPVDALMAELEDIFADATDPYRIAHVEGSHAAVAFPAGRFGEARQGWGRVMDLIVAPEVLPWTARAALWDRDVDGARADLAALDASGLHGPALKADRTTIRAGIAALEGRSMDAMGLYREALRAWRNLGLAWDEAQCGIDMAILLDPADPEVRAAAESARKILMRLEARPFLELLERRLAEAVGFHVAV